MKLHIIVLLLVIGTFAENVEETIEKTYIEETMNFLNECGSTDTLLCFKERALHYVDNLPSSLVIGGGLSIKPNEDGIDRSARQYSIPELPEEPRAREDAIDKILADRILNYFASHTIEFKVPDAAMRDFKRSIEEGRKKKNKKGNMMPLLLLMKLKMATLAAVALKGLALLAFKALVLAKIALTLTVIIGLKKLTDNKHHSSSYEVVAHDDHHGHYRSFGQDLAYRAYKEDSTGNKNS